MYEKLFQPISYTSIGMRENIYIVTFMLMVLFLIYYFFAEFSKFFLDKLPILSFWFGVIKYSFIIVMVYTFLRPISQFIYFQF
jgi:hypothetical protein